MGDTMADETGQENQHAQDAPPPVAASTKEVDDLKERVSGQDRLIRRILEATGAKSPDDIISGKVTPAKADDKPKPREDEPDEKGPDKTDKKYWTDAGDFLQDVFLADTARHEVRKAQDEEASENEDDTLADALQSLPERYRKDDAARAKNLRMLRLIAWERNGAKAVRPKDAKAAVAELLERDQGLIESALEEADKAGAERRKGEMPEAGASEPAGVLKLSIPVEAEKDRTKRAELAVDAIRKQRVGT